MRILITGGLVFLIWAVFSSWLYVCKIKPACTLPAETSITADTIISEPAPPPLVETPKPGTLNIYYEFNKSSFNPESQTDQQTVLIKEWIAKHPDAMIAVIGHTDSKGTDEYNQSLGLKRAESASKYLAGKGIDTEKIKAGSKGENEPVADNSSEEGRSKNRRTEIIIK